MFRFYSFISVVFLSVCLTACLKKTVIPDSAQVFSVKLDSDGLPLPTDTGANTFGFMAEDTGYWGCNFPVTNMVSGELIPGDGDHLHINLAILDAAHIRRTWALEFVLDTALLRNDTAILLGSEDTGGVFARVEKTISLSTTVARIITNETATDSLSILKVRTYDQVKHILSCDFSLLTKDFNLTKGRFDVKFNLKNLSKVRP